MSERNWKRPPTENDPGRVECGHRTMGPPYAWDKLVFSRILGAAPFDYQVIHTMETVRCAECPYTITDIASTCTAPTREEVAGAPEEPETPTDTAPEIEIHSPTLNLPHEPKIGLGPEFWKGLKSYRIIQEYQVALKKNPRCPCPYGRPSSLLSDLMVEVHAITGGHSAAHLEAHLAEKSRGIVDDARCIKAFTRLLRNVQTVDRNEMQIALIRHWGLGILPTGESWLLSPSLLSTEVFDWLALPEEEFFPVRLRAAPSAIIGIPETSPKTPMNAEMQEAITTFEAQMKKAEEDHEERVKATKEERTRRLPPFALQPGGKLLHRSADEKEHIYLPALSPEWEEEPGSPEFTATCVYVAGLKLSLMNATQRGVGVVIYEDEKGELVLVLTRPTRKG